MIPVTQDKFGGQDAPPEESGNCFAACIASILELPLSEVPNFCAYSDWNTRVNNWLEDYGMFLITIEPKSWYPRPRQFDDCYSILSGPSGRGLRHCVVGKGEQMVHDPHPSRAGLDHFDQIDLFVNIDPALLDHQKMEAF
jgi:hypothetical protein